MDAKSACLSLSLSKSTALTFLFCFGDGLRFVSTRYGDVVYQVDFRVQMCVMPAERKGGGLTV